MEAYIFIVTFQKLGDRDRSCYAQREAQQMLQHKLDCEGGPITSCWIVMRISFYRRWSRPTLLCSQIYFPGWASCRLQQRSTVHRILSHRWRLPHKPCSWPCPARTSRTQPRNCFRSCLPCLARSRPATADEYIKPVNSRRPCGDMRPPISFRFGCRW